MSLFLKPLVLSGLVSNLTLAGPALDQAEVRLPYAELKSLVAGANSMAAKPQPDPSLLSAVFRLTLVEGKPVIDATFRTATFADGLAHVPLVGGDLTIARQQPPDARVVVRDGMLCQAVEKGGSQVLELRLLPLSVADGAEWVLPACPAAALETGDLGEEVSIAVKVGGREQVLGANRRIALPLVGGSHSLRMLGGEETREALRPPEPSVWTWQQQALVIPEDGAIRYRVLASASANAGSGVAASVSLPADAVGIGVSGEDLAGHQVTRRQDRSLDLAVTWKTRGQLERELAISYSLPRKPLDRSWKLRGPTAASGEATRTRFIVAASPDLTYTADGLEGPFSPKGLPSGFGDALAGAPCYQLEGTGELELTVQPLPVVPVADATLTEALWQTRVEPDGAVLVEATMTLDCRGVSVFPLHVPAGLTLLSCEVGDRSVTPVVASDGSILIHLLGGGAKNRVSCAFTGRAAAMDAVQGTVELTLPKTPLFIRTLSWRIELPSGYQAETGGNLVREAVPDGPPSRLMLRKNLCRDEQPVANVFYQKSAIKN
ncbi:MAG: hypothetical protein V4640_01010 [Verrucomicrobiota bacterium]